MIDINFHLNEKEIEKILYSNGYEIETVSTKADTAYTHGSEKDYMEDAYTTRIAYKKGERPAWLENPKLQGIDYRCEFEHVAKRIIIDKLMGLFCE